MASKWIPTLPGLIFEERESHIDSRGSFIRFLELDGNSFSDAFSSIALSRNPIAGTIRGLHFQNYPYSEEKAIMCIKGSIFEVFVDLRRQCQTYGHWTHRVLSSTNFSVAMVPKGIAHGYQTLEEDTWVLYGLTSTFSTKHAHRILYKDPLLAIEWPLAVTLISDADANGMTWIECHKQNFEFANHLEI
jgi:dTDP-4-dehydrorhamnose 3,5-epimerase